MKTNRLKKIIIILCILLAVISILILSLIFVNLKKTSNTDNNEDQETTDYIREHGIDEMTAENEQKQNNSIQRYYLMVVSNCMQGFLNTININSTSYFTVQDGKEIRLYTEEEIGNQVYELLSNNYIEKNNIQINNVFNYVEKLEYKSFFIPLEIKELENENLKTYIIHGIVENDNYNFVKEIYATVNIDDKNMCYSIEPLEGNYKSIDDIKVSNLEKTITKQNLNIYTMPSTSTENMIRFYIDLYKRLALGNTELSYEYLNQEYREKRFGSVEEYKNYIQKNRDYIIGINSIQYKTEEIGSGIKYIVIDNKDNYIIINETEPLKFDIILDAYTIDVDEVSERYNSSSNSQKVGMNINKFIQMINRKDYITSYKVLADSFKNSKFKTQTSFEQYIKNNFYENNKIEILQTDESGNYYTITANLINKNGNETKQISIVMQLKEGTDFVMSFSLE